MRYADWVAFRTAGSVVASSPHPRRGRRVWMPRGLCSALVRRRVGRKAHEGDGSALGTTAAGGATVLARSSSACSEIWMMPRASSTSSSVVAGSGDGDGTHVQGGVLGGSSTVLDGAGASILLNRLPIDAEMVRVGWPGTVTVVSECDCHARSSLACASTVKT